MKFSLSSSSFIEINTSVITQLTLFRSISLISATTLILEFNFHFFISLILLGVHRLNSNRLLNLQTLLN